VHFLFAVGSFFYPNDRIHLIFKLEDSILISNSPYTQSLYFRGTKRSPSPSKKEEERLTKKARSSNHSLSEGATSRHRSPSPDTLIKQSKKAAADSAKLAEAIAAKKAEYAVEWNRHMATQMEEGAPGLSEHGSKLAAEWSRLTAEKAEQDTKALALQQLAKIKSSKS
jgi:hypothetical protein